MRKWGFGFLFLAVSNVGAFAHEGEALFDASEYRLVETAPGQEEVLSGAELHEISLKAHQEGRCGGFMDLTDWPSRSDFTFRSLLDFDRIQISQQTAIEPMLRKVNTGDLVAKVAHLSSYLNRYYQSQTGVEAAQWIRDQYIAMGRGRSDIRVELVSHNFAQPSVIATIEGAGPAKNEIVIIGGHLDSINQSAIFNPRGAVAPGADDNASGTATVMEAFRIFVESGIRPNRTLQFMGYAGEEKGLLGSADIARSYQGSGKVVIGALQLDMTMFPGKDPAIVFMSDYTDAGLTRFTQRLIDQYVKVKWKTDRCGYPCSDHASWNRAGYPSVMPFESTFADMNHKIHTPSDTLDLLDSQHGSHFVKLAIAFATELAQAN